MARYDKEHKLATRQRITETAGRRFKRDGIDGSGIATLMSDAGLTNGAFYAHFESKESRRHDRRRQVRGQREWISGTATDRAGVERIVREYLSPAHRDKPEEGCPSAALLDEIGRCPARPSRPIPTVCSRSSTTSPPYWRRTIPSRRGRRRSVSTR